MKVLVIGLDGATWDLIRPWAENGILPNLNFLRKNGVYGNLTSTIPPVTVPAWISFVTGKNPGKIGCYDFLTPRKSLNNLRPITSKDIHGKTFYEILDENGKKCIILNLPGTYPPRIKEIVITSLLTQGDNFIFPPELIHEIPQLKNWRLVSDRSLYVNGKIIEYINDFIQLEKTRFEGAKELLKKKPWDFFFLLFNGTDALQHIMYDKIKEKKGDVVKLYKEIDEYIGWFINNVPKDTNILVISDHGFRVYKKTFFINGWLRKEGYLKIKGRVKSRTIRHRSEMETENAISKRINIKLPIFLLNYYTWIYPVYAKLRKILPIELRTDVAQPDSNSSIAYCTSDPASNFGYIYINDKKRFIDGIVSEKNYETYRDEIINKLKKLKDPKTSETVIKKVWKKEEIYFGSKLTTAPDIILEANEKYYVTYSPPITKYFDDRIVHNKHTRNGIFIAFGLDLKKGYNLDIKIYDLAPTILFMFDIPIPKDMDGRVLKEIFK
ncbi:MAG: alkaline phosphatase family protein [Methanosarcinales archaeon]